MQVTALIGKKSYQKQGFLEDGRRIPLTGVIVAGNFITQIKTQDKEGYNSLQLGMGDKRKPRKSISQHTKKAGLQKSPRFFREVRVDDLEGATLGSELNVSEIFTAGDMVDVTGVSKGKGFAGGVKRHNFKGGPRTHGQSDRERAPGSIGQTTTPGRVYKGKRMAGRMGHEQVTVKNLEVIEVTNDGVLLINGLVPGSLNSLVVVKKTGTNKKFVPLYKEKAEGSEAAGRSSISEDAQPAQADETKSDAASLNESQPPTSDETKEEKTQAALNSSENVQASSVPQEKSEETKKESKEEIKEENAS